MEKVSEQVIDQRIRNRVIEWLERAASFSNQTEYQLAVPGINFPYELVNSFEDWVHGDPRSVTLPDIFSADESEAISVTYGAWDAAADALPDTYPSLADAQALPEWEVLRSAAERALVIFAIRGRFSEDDEADG